MIIIKKIVHILSIVCYLLIGIYAVICIPMIFKLKPLVVLSGSMEPTFKVGSIIYYEKANIENINENDIITFKSGNGTVVTHRVYKKEDNKFITKGDANETPDAESVSYENIEGKVKNITIPYIGYYINFIKHHMYLIFVVVIILVSEFLLSGDGNNKKKQKEVDN